jgi:hypothetical protein
LTYFGSSSIARANKNAVAVIDRHENTIVRDSLASSIAYPFSSNFMRA